MKMYIVKSLNGNPMRRTASYGTNWEVVDNVWEATLFTRRSDAMQTKPVLFGGATVHEVDVRVKEKN